MQPLTDKEYLLEKFQGKGGWTYARIPEILPDKTTPFGWVRVKGSIDGVEINAYHLMPMGNGSLFLPVKAEIRKKIKKQEGDTVRVILFADNDDVEIPGELLDCLRDDEAAHKYFFSLTPAEQKAYANWIYSAKKEETRISRMATAINMLGAGKRLFKNG
jgi:hypothetical protein